MWVRILYKVTVSSPSDAALPLDLRMFGLRMCVMCFKWAQSKADKNIFEGKKHSMV